MDEDLEVQKYVVLQDGQVVGAVYMVPDASAWKPALEGAGYNVAEQQEAEEEVLLSCEEDNPRPCELGIALGFAQELGREAGVSTAEVDELVDVRGKATEAEVEAAVKAVVGRLPEDMQPQGKELLDVAFPR
jgi:hypothetical protein